MTNCFRRLGALLAVALLHTPAAFAQVGAGSGSADDLTGQDLLFDELPSVFSASKHEQKITEAPASVSVITAEEIRAYGYRSMSEILRSVRGFYVTDDRTYQHVGVRGFAPLGDWNVRVLLLIDGERVCDNIYDLSPVGHDFPIDVDLIERIEVVRGPNSSLYGGNAMFGVINVVTRSGRDIQGVELAAGGGTSPFGQGRVTWGDRLPGGGELLLSVAAGGSPGTTLVLPEYGTPETQNGWVEGLDWKRSYQAFVTASYQGLSLQLMHADAATGLATGIWGTVYGEPGGASQDITSRARLSYQLPLHGPVSIEAHSQYLRYQLNGVYPLWWAEPGEAGEVYTNTDYAVGDALRTEIRGDMPLARWARLVLGGQHQFNIRQLQRNYDVEDGEPIYYVNDIRRGHVVGLYAQGEAALGERLDVNAGLRYDWYSTFGATLSPRFALLLSPTATTTVKLMASQAFRPPNAYEMYYADSDILRANPQLKPELIRSVEGIVEQRIADRLTVSALVFESRLFNLIEQVELDDGWLMYDNIDSAKTQGVEAEVEGRLGGGISGRISHASTLSRVDGGLERPPNSPAHLTKINLRRALWQERLSAGLEGQFVSSRTTLTGAKLPGYLLVNATLLSRQLLRGLDLSLSVFNLLNQDYAHPVSAEHPMDALSQDGISLRARGTYIF